MLHDVRPIALVLLEQTNFIVTALTLLSILYTRSAAMLYFTAGAVVCSRIVKLMKKVFRQPRPHHPVPGKQKKSHGMPSTHSAVITYYAAYTLLACLRLPIHSSLPASPLTRIVAPMIILPWSAIVAVSRIWLRHHTWPQVVVGCANGLVFAPLWFHLWTHGASRYGYFLEQAYFVW
ncbi:hypothetical protein NLI96_g2017 [Meripilus lineatus]|uniref:Phosphatidic acid phosphatase type 2/haloperoxidase domain-containing protein n=1 Tax=Meripilus lineatus TaxID=2056292 RepID=A0AAD5YHU3_9APHY|nr:hypothetical protein NLI96_g2017 [Physisporinus lineatus]